MEREASVVRSKKNRELMLRVTKGHFATNHSHVSHFIELTDLKAQHQTAKLAAAVLADRHYADMIHTIICQEGAETIGAFLADALSRSGTVTMNAGMNICVITPELNSSGQLIFRDNTLRMVKDRNILLLLSSISTGATAGQAIQCIRYYAGRLICVDALFSIVTELGGIPVNSIFTADDVEGYSTYAPDNCKLCAENKPIDAIVNGFGYSRL